MKVFAERLKYLREEQGLTQKELASICKVSPQCVCCLEQETRNPTGSTVAVLARTLNTSADYLLGLEDDFGARTAAPMHDVEGFSEEEKKLIEDYRALNFSGRKLVKQTVETLRATSAPSEKKKRV